MPCSQNKMTFASMVSIVCVSVCCLAQNPYAPQQRAAQPMMSRGKTSISVSPEAMARHRALFAECYRYDKLARDLVTAGDYNSAENALRMARLTAPVIDGKKQSAPSQRQTLADIYRYQGRYREAIKLYLPHGDNKGRVKVHLDAALCYARLEDDARARRFYSDRAITQWRLRETTDLPGTRTHKTLLASILLAHGISVSIRGRDKEAYKDFEEASRLVPENGLAAYQAGRALGYLDRYAEALPFFRTAVRRLNPRSKLMEDAKYQKQISLYSLNLQKQNRVSTARSIHQ